MTNTDKELSSSVYVGGKEPTGNDRKKVWMQKGKNYLDISKLKARTTYGITFTPTDTGIKISGTATDTYAYGEKISIALKKGIKYTLSGKNAGNILKIDLLKQDASTIIMNVKTVNDEITFIPTEDVFYIQFILEGITKSTAYDYEISNLQIEQGLKTPYEDYIEQKIYVRNKNGVYEEFIKKSEEVYSTVETKIGTWVDGKPLYRKVISSTLPKVTTEDVGVTKTVSIDADIRTGFIETAYFNKDNQMMPMPFIFTGGQIIKSYMGLNGTITLWSNTTYVNEQPVTIIVCYTKTTD